MSHYMSRAKEDDRVWSVVMWISQNETHDRKIKEGFVRARGR
jgi:hypothetical protein